MYTMETKEYLEELVAKARVAQAEFETYPQEKVDAACRAVCKESMTTPICSHT